MSEGSNLLFNRTDAKTNIAVWDDTALIRAYDKAVGKIKHDLNRNIVDSEEKSHKAAQKSAACSEYWDNKEESVLAKDWKVGDECYAIYNDGYMYPAKIIEIDDEDRTCLIRYDYYDNEEEKDFAELYDAGDEYKSFKDLISEEEEELVDEKKKQLKTKKEKKPKKPDNSTKPLVYSECAIPPPPPPPLIDQQMLTNLANLNLDKAIGHGDNDAFYAMLMSWYTSGYHTGYYFGRVQSQADTKK
jgi:survival motor neuron protein